MASCARVVADANCRHLLVGVGYTRGTMAGTFWRYWLLEGGCVGLGWVVAHCGATRYL